MLDWQNPKITKVQTTNPQPDGVISRGWPKNIRETCSTTPHAHYEPKDDAISHWNSTTPPPAHTHKRRLPHSAQNKGRQTHPRNKSTLAHYRVLKQHQHTQTNPHTVSQHQSDFGIHQRLFSCPPHKPENFISLSSGALSVSLTRYKLHTPHTQHKPAAHRLFSTCS